VTSLGALRKKKDDWQYHRALRGASRSSSSADGEVPPSIIGTLGRSAGDVEAWLDALAVGLNIDVNL
jgi:hypothetical protein